MRSWCNSILHATQNGPTAFEAMPARDSDGKTTISWPSITNWRVCIHNMWQDCGASAELRLTNSTRPSTTKYSTTGKSCPCFDVLQKQVSKPKITFIASGGKNCYGSVQGIEPRTSCTQSRNHTTRPNGRHILSTQYWKYQRKIRESIAWLLMKHHFRMHYCSMHRYLYQTVFRTDPDRGQVVKPLIQCWLCCYGRPHSSSSLDLPTLLSESPYWKIMAKFATVRLGDWKTPPPSPKAGVILLDPTDLALPWLVERL